MATSSIRPQAAIGTPYISITAAMQAFYATRGMWQGGCPQGLLATWLGEQCPWPSSTGAAYWTTYEGLQSLHDDACAVPPQAWPSDHQRAQFLRRLRESAMRAGKGAVPTEAVSRPNRLRDTAVGAAVPFEPLVCPPAGRQRKAFEDHVMKTVRDFVDFTQGSAYTGEAT